MQSLKRRFGILLLALFAMALAGPARAAAPLDFAVIQPGQPGTPEEAQPVMDALAAYLEKRLGAQSEVRGSYYNDIDPALDHLRSSPPAWGIVSLGFFLDHADGFDMTPLASTRPAGEGKDIWRLAVKKEGPDDWRDLEGELRGTMLFTPLSATCLLFGADPERLPFAAAGTSRPLASLRDAARGKVAGVVLDRRQHRAMQPLPLAGGLKIIHATGELPTSPVVRFGQTRMETERLAAVLLGMAEDPQAADLLRLLQTDGFGPPDADLSELMRKTDDRCTP